MRCVLLAAIAVATWYNPQVLLDKGGLPACYGMQELGVAPGLVLDEGIDGLVAVDAGMLLGGVVECGEVLTVYYPDYGAYRRYMVWDMGPLMSYGHYIEDYHDLPYMLDIVHYNPGGPPPWEGSQGWPVALDGLYPTSARVMILRTQELPEKGRTGVY